MPSPKRRRQKSLGSDHQSVLDREDAPENGIDHQMEDGLEQASNGTTCPSLKLTIFRDCKEFDVDLLLGYEAGMAPERLVHWCGAQLQVK